MWKLEPEIVKKYAVAKLLAPLQTQSSLAEIFHENTKLTRSNSLAYFSRISALREQPGIGRILSKAYKVYSLSDVASLEPALATSELEQVIRSRRSVRRYTGEAVTIGELSRLLHFSYGRTGNGTHYRAVPSGGALYPLELYVIALRVDRLDPGIYHYNVEQHCLDILRQGDCLDKLKECVFFDEIDIGAAGVLFVVSVFFRRYALKYQDRGYRMALIEAGEAVQNLGLLAVSLGLGSCLVGGFCDDELNGLLGLDGVNESSLIPIAVGRAGENKEGSPGVEH